MAEPFLPTLLPIYEKFEVPPFPWHKRFRFFRFLAGNPTPTKQEGFYWRFVYAPSLTEICLQVVLYYRRQWFPYHVNDFHPFYAYFDQSGKLLRLLYDQGHHYSAQIEAPPAEVSLTVRFPWHAYESGRSRWAAPLQAPLFHLTDRVLRNWWWQPGKPQFKLRSKFVDPWHPGLKPAGDAIGTFRDEAICPCCKDVTLLDIMELKEQHFSLGLICDNGHPFTATFDPARMKMEAWQTRNSVSGE